MYLLKGILHGVLLGLFIVAMVFLWAWSHEEKPYVPCETDNVEQEVHYGRDGDSRLMCWVTEYDDITGVNWVMKFEVIEEEPSE